MPLCSAVGGGGIRFKSDGSLVKQRREVNSALFLCVPRMDAHRLIKNLPMPAEKIVRGQKQTFQPSQTPFENQVTK